MAEYNFYDNHTYKFQHTKSFDTDEDALYYATHNDLVMEKVEN